MDTWASLYSIDGYFLDRANNDPVAGSPTTRRSTPTPRARALSYITVNNYGTTCPSSYYADGVTSTSTPGRDRRGSCRAASEPLQGWESSQSKTNHFAQVIYSCTSANLDDPNLTTLLGRNTYYIWLAEDALYQTEPSCLDNPSRVWSLPARSLGPTAQVGEDGYRRSACQRGRKRYAVCLSPVAQSVALASTSSRCAPARAT